MLLADLSILSNITSFEFESKILKNNYKEYLVSSGAVGSNENSPDNIRKISKSEMMTTKQRH